MHWASNGELPIERIQRQKFWAQLAEEVPAVKIISKTWRQTFGWMKMHSMDVVGWLNQQQRPWVPALHRSRQLHSGPCACAEEGPKVRSCLPALYTATSTALPTAPRSDTYPVGSFEFPLKHWNAVLWNLLVWTVLLQAYFPSPLKSNEFVYDMGKICKEDKICRVSQILLKTLR